VIGYPDRVSPEEADRWYVEVHAKEAAEQPGLLRFVSHRALKNPPFPTPWLRSVQTRRRFSEDNPLIP
jgi:hypothetical protein